MEEEKIWSRAPCDDSEQHGRNDAGIVPRLTQLSANEISLNARNGSRSEPRSTFTPDPQSVRAKQDARRLRRNLKESGDYLGVQGFNPATGKLDVITPSDSDTSSLSQETQHKLFVWKNALKDARHYYKSTKEKSEQEARKLLFRNEKEKLRRVAKEKKQIQEINNRVTWKRHARQWSSAQEPKLSPIAQSVVESTPVLRNESTALTLPTVKDNSNSSLIVLDFPETVSTQNNEAERSDRILSRSLQNSVKTVVRTPYRQSIADLVEMGPSAWELYMNGISFDSYDDVAPIENKHFREAGETNAKEKCRNQESPRPKSKVMSDHAEAHNPETSFLDRKPGRLENPGEMKIEGSKVKLIDFEDMKASQNSGNQNQSRRAAPSKGQPGLSFRIDTMDCENTKFLMKRKLPENMNERNKAAKQEDEVRDTVARKRLMPSWGQWIGRKRGPSRVLKTNSPSNSKLRENATSRQLINRATSSKGSKMSKVLASDLMSRSDWPKLALHTNVQYTNLDQELKLKTQTKLHQKSQANTLDMMDFTDSEAQGQTAPEISLRTSPYVKPECASTHITTTGCSQPGSKMNARARPGQAMGKFQCKLQRETRDKAMYSLPPIATSESSLGSSVMKLLQKQSSEVKLRNDINKANTADEFSPKPRNCPTNSELEAAVNIQSAANYQEEQDHKGTATTNQSLDWWRSSSIHMLNSSQKGTNAGAGLTEMASGSSITARNSHNHVDVLIEDELAALVRAPGCFPYPHTTRDVTCGHPSSSSHIVDLVRSAGTVTQSNGVGITMRSMPNALREIFGIAWCYIVPLWQMYWDRVGPLFLPKSEYWVRQERGEGTVRDCLTLIFAIPATIAFISGYIVTLRVALLCVENFSVVKEELDDVYWYMLG